MYFIQCFKMWPKIVKNFTRFPQGVPKASSPERIQDYTNFPASPRATRQPGCQAAGSRSLHDSTKDYQALVKDFFQQSPKPYADFSRLPEAIA